MSFSQEEIEEFKVEAQELLDISEKSLLSIHQASEYRICFDAVFRSFHNVKGGAGMMEFFELQAHTHELETILMQFKDKDSIPQNYVDLFLRGIDAARLILEGENIHFDFNIEASTEPAQEEVGLKFNHELPESAIEEFLVECDDLVGSIFKSLQSIEKGLGDREDVDNLYRNVHSLKGSAYLFSFNKIGDIAHAMESSLDKVRNETHRPSAHLFNCLFKSLKVVELLVSKAKRKESDEGCANLVDAVGRALSLASERLVPVIESKSEVVEEACQIEQVLVSTPVATVKEREAEALSSIRVSVSLLDSLMNLMGEMVLVRNQVLQYANKNEDLELSSMSKRLNVVTSEIQEEMMKTRMQPIGNVLEKFNRVVRDLSHDLKKDIHLIIHGADTELDKSLLEAIKDPLTHIVRNSCDHGIESPEQRKQNGKNATGTITIKSYHEGGQVIVEVSDDGKGLHKEVLIKKAIEKGVLDPSEAHQLSDKEAYELIFAPGFSTAAQITNVSGRGVGMDVVRTNIEKIGGTVEIFGTPNAGTTLKLKIPLTLAIIPALVVKCGMGTFSIPQARIEELVRIDPRADQKIEVLHGVPVYRLRGEILPLVDLNKVLKIKEAREGATYDNQIINVAVLNAESFSFGVIVDEIQDTVDIVVKPLNRLLKSLQVYSGATILGDGSISLIIDALGLSKVAQLGQERLKSRVEAEKEEELSEIQELLIFNTSSPTKHALALNYVQRLEEFQVKEIELAGDHKAIRYRGDILYLVSANEQLGYEKQSSNDDAISVIVIERAGKLYGLEVNEILDTYSTALEIKDPIKKQKGIFGHLNTAEELIVIVDPFALIEKAFMIEEDRPSLDLTNYENHFSTGKILLVEDTVYFRKAMKSILEKKGYKIEVAQNGVEAINMLKESYDEFDLIISDIEMPRMNGFQLAKEVRKSPSFAKIPMIAVSSRADSDYRREGMEAGFDIYLEKLKPEVLLAAILELQQSKRSAA